jgi:hypothetical protein
MDKLKLTKDLKQEIERRRSLLIEFSYDHSYPMDPIERIRIQSLLEKWESPSKPEDMRILTKQFCVSAFSYAPLRRYLASFIGNIPMRDTISLSLSKAFNNNDFLQDSNWSPETLHKLALKIQTNKNFDLSRKQFNPRIISVLLTGTKVLSNELMNGIDKFYQKISCAVTPLAMWNLAEEFAKPISNVGVALICDFFKEIGFTRYVKVDHHFRREFPELISDLKTCKQSPKESFILSQEIADSVGITPFHLDSILYLWGRYGHKENQTVHSTKIVKLKTQKMEEPDGIIDAKNNPFIKPSWIKQRGSLTTERQEQLRPLFGKEISTIKSSNTEQYPAFLGIRWGFAIINEGKLTRTDKWNNRSNYDDRGHPFTKK